VAEKLARAKAKLGLISLRQSSLLDAAEVGTVRGLQQIHAYFLVASMLSSSLSKASTILAISKKPKRQMAFKPERSAFSRFRS